jgi:hypothetical protein
MSKLAIEANQETNQEAAGSNGSVVPLGLTVDDIKHLPVEVQSILQALTDKKKIRWLYRVKGSPQLQLSRALLAL